MQALIWLKLHWLTIAYGMGVYALVASLLNRVPFLTPDVKSPMWKVRLHQIFIDWPAALPKVDFKGIFGLPVNVPYLTLSQAAKDIGNTDLLDKTAKLVIVGLLGGALLSACTIVNATRAVADAAALGQATGVVVDGVNEAKDADIIAECRAETTKTCVKARADLEAWKVTRSKARAALTAFRSVLLGCQATLMLAQQAKDGNVDVSTITMRIVAATALLTKELAALGITTAGGAQ